MILCVTTNIGYAQGVAGNPKILVFPTECTTVFYGDQEVTDARQYTTLGALGLRVILGYPKDMASARSTFIDYAKEGEDVAVSSLRPSSYSTDLS